MLSDFSSAINYNIYLASGQFKYSLYCENNHCIHVLLPVFTCQYLASVCTSEYMPYRLYELTQCCDCHVVLGDIKNIQSQYINASSVMISQ